METSLICDALVIGTVGAAVYRTPEGLCALRLNEEGGYVDCSRQAGLLLDCPAEKRLLIGASLQEIKQSLDLWSRRQRLLQQLIGGMDRTLREYTRQLGLELAEQGLDEADATYYARARLLSCPPPAGADLDGALRLSANLPACQRLYNELAIVRDYIAPIGQALQELLYFDFSSETAADELYRALVDRGVVAEAVLLSVNSGAQNLGGLVFKFQRDTELQRACPRLAHLLAKFVSRVKAMYPAVPETVKIGTPRFAETETDSDKLVEAVKQLLAWRRRTKDKRLCRYSPADRAREAADKQKTFILESVDKGRLGTAEVALMDLVRNQGRDGLLKHLCKSLCALGAQFTERGYFDLAVRTYIAARVANPKDAVCYTGYAETLRELGRPEEALEVYAEAKGRFANNAVCYNGYAETLRELGRLEEALEVYAEAKGRFANNVVCYNGYAETLREMGRPEEALEVYAEAKGRFANEVYCYTGYAETLRELGRPEEALEVYAEAKGHFANDAVCYTGYAETLRELGQLGAAIPAYQEAVSRFSRDGVARNALACLFVEHEKYDEVEKLLTGERPRSLQNWRDFHVLAMAKLSQGLWAETRAMLERGMAETPFAQQRQVFQTSLAVLALRRKQPNIAEGNLEVSKAQIIQFPLRAVLRAHAVASQYRTEEARGLLEQVKGYT